jgi:hypothetical protein
MIKLFQNIRQSLINKNQTGRYLKYAIGEIVLVVIGILLALQINNKNEERKTEDKIFNILKEVQKDLGEDILKSEVLFNYYRNKDSIIQLVIDNKLTRQDYLGNNMTKYIYVAADAFHLKIHNNGYKILTDNLNDIPEKYQETIAPLNEIYTYNKYEIDKYDSRLDKITDRLLDQFAASIPSYFGVRHNQIGDEAIQYFLNDSLYKNTLHIYSMAAKQLKIHVAEFSENAIHTYAKIAEFTGYPEELPDFIPHNLTEPPPNLLKELNGNYKLVKIKTNYGAVTSFDEPYIIKANEEGVELISEEYNFSLTNLYYKSNAKLYGINTEATIIKNDNDRVSGLLVKFINQDVEFIKKE